MVLGGILIESGKLKKICHTHFKRVWHINNSYNVGLFCREKYFNYAIFYFLNIKEDNVSKPPSISIHVINGAIILLLS